MTAASLLDVREVGEKPAQLGEIGGLDRCLGESPTL
jgi:hypothetical protein